MSESSITTFSKFVQLANAPLLIAVMPAGMVSSLRFWSCRKACAPTSVMGYVMPSIVADVGKFPHESVGQVEGEWHQVRCLVAGVTEHHALIACSLVLIVILGTVHTLGDVATLLMHTVEDATRVGVKLVLTLGVTDFLNHLAGGALQVDIDVSGHLTSNNDLPGCHERLTCHVSLRVKGKELVQDGVADLVSNFVGVSFGHALRRE